MLRPTGIKVAFNLKHMAAMEEIQTTANEHPVKKNKSLPLSL